MLLLLQEAVIMKENLFSAVSPDVFGALFPVHVICQTLLGAPNDTANFLSRKNVFLITSSGIFGALSYLKSLLKCYLMLQMNRGEY